MRTRQGVKWARNLCISTFCCVVLAHSAFAAGVTIITHGLQPDTGFPAWENDMANAIAARIRGANGGINPTIYTLRVGSQSTLTLDDPSGQKPSDTGEVIIKVDWSNLASLLGSKAGDVGAVVADALRFGPSDGSFTRPFVELPLHFIGHSRGTYVNSAAIRELGRKGIWVDHCTILDGQAYGADGDLAVWSNIKFADNYYQTLAFDHLLDGFPISGTVGFDLSSLPGFGADPRASSIMTAHQRVHTYYHGTIGLGVTKDIDGQDIRRSDWYPLDAGAGSQPIRGFYFTRIVPDEYLKADFLAGLSQLFGGYAPRQDFLTSDGSPQWPNVVLQNSDNKWTFTNGTTIRIYYPYSDTDSQTTISFATDDDQNPYNNSPGNEVVTFSKNPTQGGPIPDNAVFSWNPTSAHHNRYLYAKVTDNQSHTRYYYLPQKFMIGAVPEPPPAIPGNDLVLSYSNPRWDDRVPRGDGDGVPEGGEKLNLQLSLRNQASSVLQYVKTKLTTTVGNVTIVEPDVVYGYLNPGESSWSGSYFSLELDSTATSGAAFQLRATYGKNNVSYYQDFAFLLTFYVNRALEPRFVVDHVQWNDGNGNGDGDGVLESGEAGSFDVFLRNTGNATATQVRATIRNAPAFIRLHDLTVDYPDLIAGGSSEKGRTGNFFAFDNLVPTTFAGTANADIVILYSGSSQEYVMHDQPLFVVSPAPWLGVQWIGANAKKADFGVAPSATNLIFSARVDNYGSADMHVDAISTSVQDTVWTGDPLPWTIAPGAFKSFQVTLSTTNLQGQIRREVIVSSDGRFYPNPYPDNQPDRVVISGLVSDLPPVFEIPLGSSGNVVDVDVSGNIVVWADSRNGNYDIYGYDLARRLEFQITSNAQDQRKPRISGNLIVWEDLRNWNGQGTLNKDIYGYNLVTRQEFVVSTDPSLENIVGVDGSLIAFTRVYAETPSPNSRTGRNLYVFDTNNGATTPLTTFAASGGNPIETVEPVNWDFGGDTPVWRESTYVLQGVDWVPSDHRLMKQNFNTDSAPIRILSGFIFNAPSANQGRIAWAKDTPSTNSASTYPQIYLWDNGSIRQLTTEERDHANSVLALGNSFVAYNKEARPGVYYYDLTQGIEGQVTDKPVPEFLRADANGIAFIATNHIFYTVLNQSDLAVSSDDIGFSNPAPIEGDVLDVSVSIHNLTKLGTTNDITVRLYDGDPDFGGVQLGTNGIISGGLAAFASATVTFNSVPVGPAGTHNIFARFSMAIAENPANNKATKVLEVRAIPQSVSFGEIDPVGFETGSKPAVIAVQRTGSTNAALTVNYTISGTASNGVDYAALSGTAIIPAGLASALIQVIPSDDLLPEGDETVVLTLSTNSAYAIISPSMASAVIADNDTPITNWPSFSGPSSLQNGTFRFNLVMERGRIYVVDYSTNLVNWSQLVSNVAPFSLFEFVDNGATNDTQRFYRIKHP